MSDIASHGQWTKDRSSESVPLSYSLSIQMPTTTATTTIVDWQHSNASDPRADEPEVPGFERALRRRQARDATLRRKMMSIRGSPTHEMDPAPRMLAQATGPETETSSGSESEIEFDDSYYLPEDPMAVFLVSRSRLQQCC